MEEGKEEEGEGREWTYIEESDGISNKSNYATHDHNLNENTSIVIQVYKREKGKESY